LREQRDETGRVPQFLGTVAFTWTEDLLNWYCHHKWRFKGHYSASSPIAPAVLTLARYIVWAIIAFFAFLAIREVRTTVVEIAPLIPPWGWGAMAVGVALIGAAMAIRAIRK